MAEQTHQTRVPAWLVGLLLGGVVLGVYARAVGLDFINFDDDDYVTRNEHVRQGLTADGVRWAITSLDEVNWHPVTWLSLQLDTQLFGPGPVGYHRTNVLLHAGNTVLLFWLLYRTTAALWPSAVAAGFFGLHPVHVEAVAWVTARKDVLSTFFWLLATVAYVRYARRPGVGRYALVVLPFTLGLASKQMLVTLPAALLLLDYWPLGRWPAGVPWAAGYAPASARRLVLEKLPLLALTVPAALLTLWAQAPIIHPLSDYTVYDRIANALVSCVIYLRMVVWPTDLAILYPLPRGIPVWQPVAAFALLAAATAGAVRTARTRPYLIVGWLWFLGTLVPVIGLVQNGPQARADRYAYVPYIGLYVAAAWAGATAPPARRALALLGVVALVACAGLARHQMGYWRDSETLWRHALAATTDNAGAHTMLAKTLLDKGEFPEAVEQFEAALRMEPDNVANLGNIAVGLMMTGRPDEAAGYLERSLRLRPGHAATHFNLGSVRERQNRLPEALAHYTTAVELDPGLTAAGVARAGVLSRLGEFARAREQLDRLLAAEPNSPALHTELGRLLGRQRRFAEAVAAYDRALGLAPDHADAWNAKGFAVEGLGRPADAAECYRRAVALRPRELQYRLNLAHAESALGRDGAAAEQFRAAFELRPDWPAATLADAWARATHPDAARRDGAVALRAATLVCRLTNDRMPQALDTQAAALAELGEFDQAAARQRQALALLGPDTPPPLLAAVTERLHLYERRQPYRQGPPAASGP
ncbi:MAG TPA: tetratricopeptide repeat protein [Urbifossiella sp.]|jgi:tetratricopeptide (TPR) repeat protein|nr:tetratricopeptide repeat protein [Urbifossiella sp.]